MVEGVTPKVCLSSLDLIGLLVSVHSGKLRTMSAHDLAYLRSFRTALHACFECRADALFELGDALLASDPVTSLPHLSLQSGYRRGWGSLYDALGAGRIDGAALRALLMEQAPLDGPPVYAVDLSVWPRCDAEASPERGFYYHPSRHSAGQPIVAGWAYQWLTQLSFTRDSWTAPLDIPGCIPVRTPMPSQWNRLKTLRSRPSV